MRNNLKLKRNMFLDIVKGIAIILVIIGHNIQFGSGLSYFENNLYYENYIFKLIYSFHMPLFMLISGYLFAFSIKKYTFVEQLKSKLKKLIVPILSWSFVFLLVEILKIIVSSGTLSFNVLVNYFDIVINSLWFLWAIFYCSIIVLLINKFFKDSLFIYFIIFIALFFLPDNFNFYLYKFMYPYFVIGYIFNKKELLTLFKKYFDNSIKKTGLLIFLLITFIVLFLQFDYNSYIYTSKISIYGNFGYYQIIIDIYRWIIGFIGSSLLLLMLNLFIDTFKFEDRMLNKSLMFFGKNSLIIYIIDDFLNRFIFLNFMENVSFNYLLILVETIVVMIICFIGNFIIKRVPVLKNLLLGFR